jgi:D-sedoheptulose 7-phosphate isomerase
LANDRHYDQIFVEQLRNFLQRNDIVIGISASGNADNVFNALKYAKERKNFTVSLSGNDGGKIAKVANLSWVVPSFDQQIIEDVMQTICHVIVRTIFYREQGFVKNHLEFADIAILREKDAYLVSRNKG